MGDAIISRRGSEASSARTINPSINFVSKTDAQFVVTFTNNDATEAEIYYGLTAPLTDIVTLAAAATSSNITFSGLDDDTAFTVSAYALVTDPTSKKIKSEIVTTVITTDAPIFTAATGGTTLEYNSSGKRYRSHTFLSDNDFVVTTVGNGDRNQVDYLIIAGGGAGAKTNTSNQKSGGGGAGGYRTTLGTSGRNSSARNKVTVTATTFQVTIGAGGAAVTSQATFGNDGNASSALGVSTVGGGGGGAAGNSVGRPGGSGGGAGSPAGSGTIDEGHDGGNPAPFATGGGGGGAGEAGLTSATATQGTRGGNGLGNTLRTGGNNNRAGGGGGAGSASAGSGGAGGGGAGSVSGTGTSGTANTGSGGGGLGSGSGSSGSGGSGIVVVRYEIAPSV